MEAETRKIPLDLADIQPDEVHSMREWAGLLGIGEANIRTAIREKKLGGTLTPMKNKKGEVIAGARWEMTGQQVLDWRNHIGVHTSSATLMIKDTVSGRIRVQKDQLDEVNQYLAAKYPDVQITLPKYKSTKTEGVTAQAVEEMDLTTNIPAPVKAYAEPEVPSVKPAKKGFFGS